MKIEKFVEIMEANKGKIYSKTNVNAMSDFIKKTLEVKDYLPLQEKKDLISKIIDSSIIYENSMYKFDEIDKYVHLVMFSIAAYTNIELSDDIENDYDELCRSGLLTMIVDSFKDEYKSVMMLLDMQCNYILADNALGAKFGTFIEGLSKNINSLADVLKTKIEDINLDSLNIDLNNVQSLLEKFK